MRRDEVSALAGISTAYYTWIEQGRKFDVSSTVLEAIAGALRLNDIESAHLFALAGKAAPGALVEDQAPARTSPDALPAFVSAFVHGPALLLTPWLDVVGGNRSASEVLGIASGANLAEAVLCRSALVRITNADALAGAFVALLRRNHAIDVENERFHTVITRLRGANATFKAAWDTHVIDRTALLDFEVERAGIEYGRFHGVIVADPIAVRQFALFMYRSNESIRQPRGTKRLDDPAPSSAARLRTMQHPGA